MENRNEKDPQEKGSDELSKSVDGANIAELDALAALASGKENADVFITAANLIGSAVQAGVDEIAIKHNEAINGEEGIIAARDAAKETINFFVEEEVKMTINTFVEEESKVQIKETSNEVLNEIKADGSRALDEIKQESGSGIESIKASVAEGIEQSRQSIQTATNSALDSIRNQKNDALNAVHRFASYYEYD